jgi:uracil-DNA glycosylase family 4
MALTARVGRLFALGLARYNEGTGSEWRFAVNPFTRLEQSIINCDRCPRLREWCEHVAAVKTRRYRDQEYWGRPVHGFGDKRARLILLGLAPGAHGANRTGRVFTGDESGVWLYEALHKFGFANQPHSQGRGDGLVLTDAYISNIVRCAPPQNRPTAEEIAACRSHLEAEFDLLTEKKVIVALGQLAFDQYKKMLKAAGVQVAGVRFGHGVEYRFEGHPTLLGSYHPSQQNTFTGKLTREMWYDIFARAKAILDET